MSDTLLTFIRHPTGPARAASLLAAALAALALTAALPPAAGAQEAPAPEQSETGRRPPRHRPDLLARLNLTPEQLARLREIRRQSETEARALGRRVRLARRALDEAIYADAFDERLVEERARELAAAQAALVNLRAQTELRVRRVLTPEQLQTFRDLRQRARRRGPRHRQP